MKASGQRAHFLFGLIALGLGALATPSSLLANLNTGLVGWYPLDGNVEDASGNNHHGTVVHGASPVTDRHGQTGKSYQVLDSHISITNPLLPQGSSSRTLSVWAKSNSSGSNSRVISQWGSNTTNQAFGLFLDEKSFWGGPYGSNLGSDVTNDQEWHHLALTLVSGNLSIYVDGIERNASSITAQTTGTTLILGKEVGSLGKAFIGAVDDLRIYNRALTSSEVAQLYLLEAPVEQNATVSGTINYTGPVTGPVVIWAKLGALTVNTLTLPNGPGAYTMQLPKNRRYDIKAFRDGNGNGALDAGWQVGEPYAHHGDWNSTSSSFNTFLLDGNKTGIDVNVSWHGDHDNDGFYDWDEYVAGSEGNDSTSVPGIGYGLIAHWTFDETNGTVLGDSSGNDVNGTLNGFSSHTNTHWTPGRVGGALHFDGTNDYVSFPGATLLNDLAPMTFAGWVMRETDPDGGYIIAKRSGGAGYWRLNSGNNDLSWVRRFTGNHPSFTSTSPTVLDQWTHLAFTWNGEADGANTQLYLDGVQTANPSRNNGSGSPISDSGNLFTIGYRPDGNISYFKGKLDDFRIWNRALSATDVHTLFHAPGFPLNDANFTKAIDLWFSDQATATATYGHIKDWNVSGVTNMANAFKNKTTFNEDIGGWDVSNITVMSQMFRGATNFNQPIGGWDVSKVTMMNSIFHDAKEFNQPIGDWNVSSVAATYQMFRGATDFNQSIGDWDVSSFTGTRSLFKAATSFNQNISGWDLRNVTDMSSMFSGAIAFNQDISDWNVSGSTNTGSMFASTPALSNAHKGLIHSSFSSNSNWPYDWSAFVDTNVTLSGTVSYSGPVTGPVVVWAFENGQKVAELTLTNGPGPYSLQLLKNRNYDVKAFRDGNGNGNLDAGWQVGEPYAHHGDWNNTTSSFNTLLLDANKTGIDVNISWHNDHDNDGFYDWDEYVAGSEGNDSTSTPGLNYGLVAWYPFDGNASDMSGNGNHGTVHGATLGTDRHGRTGEAYSFDGVDDYIRIASSEKLRDLTEYTVSLWAWSQNFSANYNPLVSKSSGDISSFEIYGGNGFTLIHNRSSTYKYQYYSALPSSRWNHLLITYVNGTLSKYDDGSLHASSTSWANPEHHDFPVYIGKCTWQSGNTSLYFHHGSVDDVRIYDRALSASEVAELYHLERPGSPLTDANFTTAVNLWFSNEANATKTYGHISNWDVSGVTNMGSAFKQRTTFNENISGWDMSNVATMKDMFLGATAFNQPIGDWNVSAVTTMQNMFYNAPLFNQPIGNWNISEVLSMQGMFYKAAAFNQPIGDWNTSKVTSLQSMFWAADAFDQPIGNWDTSKVLSMQSMFQGADAFNQHIGDWNTSGVTTMNRMFNFATAFNQPIGNWNVKNVSNMAEMFYGATAFDQDVRNWNVSSVTTVKSMFQGATAFNQPIGDWNVSAVTTMQNMFYNAPLFNQPIANWNISEVLSMQGMFYKAAAFNQPIGDWNTSKVTSLQSMFWAADAFDRPIGNWDTSKVLSMQSMFQGADAFNQHIGDWNTSGVTTMNRMFNFATAFNQPIGNWNVKNVSNMAEMFDDTPALSSTNKGLIHSSFSTNPNWPYDWSVHVTAPTTDNNQTENNSTSTPPVHDHNQTHPVVDDNATAPPVVAQAYRPIVRTESVRQSEDGPPRFAGTVLTNGGSPILESGFIVSQNIFLYPNLHLIAQPGESPQAFTANPQEGQLEPGKLYYYRAYAVNAVGGNYGSLKKFRVPEQSDAWWAQMPAVGGGWRDSEWFGTFRRHANTEWIYHAQLGWVYALSDQEDGLWLWSKEDGWLWTQPDVFPHLWKHRSGNWLYLMTTVGGKPVFHDYATGSVR